MKTEDAQALRIDDLGSFMQYVQEVWAGTQRFLEPATEDALNAVPLVRPLGEMAAVRALAQACLPHAYQQPGQFDPSRTTIGAPALGS